MKQMTISERLAHWDQQEDLARKDDRIELALIFESLRELARNQRVVDIRQRPVEVEGISTYCDIIHETRDFSSFGLDLLVQTDDTGVAEPLEYGHVRFTKLQPGQTLPEQNLDTAEDAPIADKQIIESLTSVLRGSDHLSFIYTPFVMMVQRLLSVDLDHVHVVNSPELQTWKLQARAGEYLAELDYDFGKVLEYFGS